MPVVDASVAVALYHAGDPQHRRCLEWLEERLERAEELFAPSLLQVEVAAAVRRLTGRARLARESAAGLGAWLTLLPLEEERAAAAAEVAAATGVRGADAVYLALARELREPLVTLDRQQLERGRAIARVERPASSGRR